MQTVQVVFPQGVAWRRSPYFNDRVQNVAGPSQGQTLQGMMVQGDVPYLQVGGQFLPLRAVNGQELCRIVQTAPPPPQHQSPPPPQYQPAQQQQTTIGAPVTICLQQNPRMVLNLHGAKEMNDATINLWEQNGHQSQRWVMVPVQGGAFRIHCAANQRFCLNLHGNTHQEGAKINLWEVNGHESQVWRMEGNNIVHASDCRFGINLHCDQQTNGGQINLWSRNGHPSQGWTMQQNPQTQHYAQCMSNDLHHVQRSHYSGQPTPPPPGGWHGASHVHHGGKKMKHKGRGKKMKHKGGGTNWLGDKVQDGHW
jgi:hypothetical protein